MKTIFYKNILITLITVALVIILCNTGCKNKSPNLKQGKIQESEQKWNWIPAQAPENTPSVADVKNKWEQLPDDNSRNFYLGMAYYKEKDYNNAVLHLQKVNSKDDNFILACFFLGMSYRAANDEEKCLSTFLNCPETSLTQEKKIIRWHEIGLSYCRLSRYDEAITALQKCVEIDKKYWIAWFFMGDIHHKQKRYDEAEKNYNTALEYCDHYSYKSTMHYNLGRIAYIKGEKIRAKEEIEKSLQCDPNNKLAQRAMKSLNSNY